MMIKSVPLPNLAESSELCLQQTSTHSGKRDASIIVDHLEHLIHVGGEKIAAIGTDFDGAISTPTDLKTVDQFPMLVEYMLQRRWSEERIHNILGGNFLSVLKEWKP